MRGSCNNSCEQVRQRELLHRGDARNLQNCPRPLWLLQPSLGDGHQQAGADNHVVATRIHGHLVPRGDLVPLSRVQTGESRYVAAQIEQHVELHRGQRLLPPGHRNQGRAQPDHRGVQIEDSCFTALPNGLTHDAKLRPPLTGHLWWRIQPNARNVGGIGRFVSITAQPLATRDGCESPMGNIFRFRTPSKG